MRITVYDGVGYDENSIEMRTKVVHNDKSIPLAKLICLGERYRKEKNYTETYKERSVPYKDIKIAVAEALYLGVITEEQAKFYIQE